MYIPWFRIGHGFDAHPFAGPEEGRPLVLGGVTIPHPQGMAGHSDGDVVIHAVMDALLGAAALGDIGQYFPSSDARWKEADSRKLLQQVMQRLQRAGYAVGNADITI